MCFHNEGIDCIVICQSLLITIANTAKAKTCHISELRIKMWGITPDAAWEDLQIHISTSVHSVESELGPLMQPQPWELKS